MELNGLNDTLKALAIVARLYVYAKRCRTMSEFYFEYARFHHVTQADAMSFYRVVTGNTI